MATRAVVLLSGGMDSATALAIALKEGFEVTALSVDYGQRHKKELDAARKVARHFAVRDHRVVTLDLAAIGVSALTDRKIPVPAQRRPEGGGQSVHATARPATLIGCSGNRTQASTEIGSAGVVTASGPSSSGDSEIGRGRVTASLTAPSVRSEPYRLFCPTPLTA